MQRNLKGDIQTIVDRGITDVMVLMQHSEFRKYRVPDLLEEYAKAGLRVHHHEMEDGTVPSLHQLFHSVQTLEAVISQGGRVLVHCYGGLGRTCLIVASLLLSLDPRMSPEAVIRLMRDKRGPRAVQTVRQYNTIMEFRVIEESYTRELREARSRSVSR